MTPKTVAIEPASPPEPFLKVIAEVDPSLHVWRVTPAMVNPRTGGHLWTNPFTRPLSTPFERLFEHRRPGEYRVQIVTADGEKTLPKKSSSFYVEVKGPKGWMNTMENRHEDRVEGAVAAAEETRALVDKRRAELELKKLDRDAARLEGDPEEESSNVVAVLQEQVAALQAQLAEAKERRLEDEIKALRAEMRDVLSKREEPRTSVAEIISAIGTVVGPIAAALLDGKAKQPGLLEHTQAIGTLLTALKTGAPGLSDTVKSMREILELSEMMGGGGGGEKSDLGNMLQLVGMLRNGQPIAPARAPAIPGASVPVHARPASPASAPATEAAPPPDPAVAIEEEKRRRVRAFLLFVAKEVAVGSDPEAHDETLVQGFKLLPEEVRAKILAAADPLSAVQAFAPYAPEMMESIQATLRNASAAKWVATMLDILKDEFAPEEPADDGSGTNQYGAAE